MKADVEPFPFVPAIWMALRDLKFDGCVSDGQPKNKSVTGIKGNFHTS